MKKIVKIEFDYEEHGTGICPICGSVLTYEAETAGKRTVPWTCDTCKATGNLTHHGENTDSEDEPCATYENVHLKDGTPVELVEPWPSAAGSLTVNEDCEEGVCPVCGGSLAYSGSKEDDDTGCVYPWVCEDCGATGKEGYSLSFDGNHYDVRTALGVPVKAVREKQPLKAAGGWFVPVTWEMCGVVRIPFEKAATLADAFTLIKKDISIELPKGHYVDDSFAPSYELEQVEEVRALYNDNRPDGEVPV